MGLQTGMILRGADDHMGRLVRETLARNGVDTGKVISDPRAPKRDLLGRVVPGFCIEVMNTAGAGNSFMAWLMGVVAKLACPGDSRSESGR